MLYRRRAPPAGQQRGMKVQTAEARRGQDRRRQQQPVGGGNGGTEVQRGEIPLECGIAEARRRRNRNAARLGEGVHRGRPELVAAAGRAGRLRIGAHDFMAGVQQGFEGRQGEIRRAQKGEAHGPSILLAALRLVQPPQDHAALDRGQVVHMQYTVQMVDLML